MKTEYIKLTTEEKKIKIYEFIIAKLIQETIEMSKSHIESSPLINAIERNIC